MSDVRKRRTTGKQFEALPETPIETVPETPTHPGGRPTVYKASYAKTAKKLCDNGATNLDLAHTFDVSLQTLRNWRARYPKFLAALKIGKDIADEAVERSLYERATGYSHDAVKIFCGKEGEVTKVPYVEHVPPDATAMIFWLKNRKPEEWRDRIEMKHSGKMVVTMDDTQRAAKIAAIMAAAQQRKSDVN